jgi:hypothetical protein
VRFDSTVLYWDTVTQEDHVYLRDTVTGCHGMFPTDYSVPLDSGDTTVPEPIRNAGAGMR